MLNLSNVPGLMPTINAAGYIVEQRGNTLFGIRVHDGSSGNDVDTAIQTINDTFSIAQCANYVSRQIDALATSKRNKVIAPYSPGEMAAWSIKREEALKYQALPDVASAPNLNVEAQIRGITLAELVTKVLNDAARFSAIEAAIAGTSGKHRDYIKNAATIEDIIAYDYNTGWPV